MSTVIPHDDPRATFYPDTRAVEPGVFEIAIVLAGAVSAGAYTAGVCDYLIEALDAWERFRIEHPSLAGAPRHEVRLKIVTGASAGGINGAILAVARDFRFPHVMHPGKRHAAGLPTIDESENPFFRPWVLDIDIRRFLETRDLATGRIASLLDCTVLDEIKTAILGFVSAQGSTARGWVEAVLPIVLTVTNLRGVPYAISSAVADQSFHHMTLHRDYVKFAVGAADRPAPPDAIRLPQVAGGLRPKRAEWILLGDTALATGAFPVALRARLLSRSGADYAWRSVFRLPDHDGLLLDQPAWSEGTPPADYPFLSVDGGVMDNEPFEIARRHLAGLAGSNPRSPKDADRGVILVDPFVDVSSDGPDKDVGIADLILPLFGALKNQTRFNQRDLDLITSGEVFSRYLIAPSRSRSSSRRAFRGAAALASGGLGGFLGFFHEAYRRHDYLLGRRNAQRFLQEHLVLHQENKVFTDRAGAAYGHSVAPDFRPKGAGRSDFIRVVPTIGVPAMEEPLPDWPGNVPDPARAIEKALRQRVDVAVESLYRELPGMAGGSAAKRISRFFVDLYLWPVRAKLKSMLADAALDRISEAAADIPKRAL